MTTGFDLTGMGLDPDVAAASGGGFTLVPPGKYQAVIMSDEIKPSSKNPANRVMHVRWQISKGEYAGIEIMDYWNILYTGPDPVAAKTTQDIGQGNLRLACELCGIIYPQITDKRKLYGKPMTIKVINKEFTSNKPDADGTFPKLKRNEVNSFSKAETVAAPTSTATATDNGEWG